ncbi:hypothetical protein NPA07_04305 [Mycoplasmopsis caviae]|uniref:Uncharacterized protein n=1 Tax=Mycoplasmopsis caviae TaxID=55603 RepID=A0A3P8LIB6_9BACT|nr:hypothetical protein [Mycoplasmopsis caviae]UUD35001.1 hypothetical protein NPA07_04305 [Mycoplasmopsis caviae]VDR42172.1 Uncharacterised protein [Mycoplasmopsis caviae]
MNIYSILKETFKDKKIFLDGHGKLNKEITKVSALQLNTDLISALLSNDYLKKDFLKKLMAYKFLIEMSSFG